MGRLTPELARDYLQSGWRFLFVPDDARGKQKRCLSPEEWQFFDDFFTYGDFAGIQLHVDFLAEGCESEFRSRYSDPVATAWIPGSGTAEFFAKSAQRRARTDVAHAKRLRFEPLLREAIDLIETSDPYGLVLEKIESTRTINGTRSRAMTERSASVELFASDTRGVVVEGELATFFPLQQLHVYWNGESLRVPPLEEGKKTPFRWQLTPKPGKNVLSWEVTRRGDWWDVLAAMRSQRLGWQLLFEVGRENRNRPLRFYAFRLHPQQDG